MKEKEDHAHKEDKRKDDNKEKKKKKEASSLDKKLVKELTKKIGKQLDKKMDEVLKQVRKETRRALREVLEELREEAETGTGSTGRDSLLDTRPQDLVRGQDFGAEEISVQIEPDELHMGGELEIVEVGEEEDRPAPPKGKGKATPAADPGQGPKTDQPTSPDKNSPENQKDHSPGTKRRTARTPKKGSAEQEIGTPTGTGSAVSPEA